VTVTNRDTALLGGSVTTGSVPVTGSDYVVLAQLTGADAQRVYDTSAYSATARAGLAGGGTGVLPDVTVWYTPAGMSGPGAAQLDTDADVTTAGVWSDGSTGTPANIALWFRLQAPIAPGLTDDHYTLAWGAPQTGAGAHDWSRIYPFFDDFSGASLWTAPHDR